MAPDELLARLSGTLRHEIGPAVAEPFPRTQAFMASVILEKLSAQLRLAAEHATAEAADLAALSDALPGLLGADTPVAVASAVAGLAAEGSATALAALVAALWDEREGLGPERFDAVLARVRITLRARIDRQMAYAA
jgi:hypothetical protein